MIRPPAWRRRADHQSTGMGTGSIFQPAAGRSGSLGVSVERDATGSELRADLKREIFDLYTLFDILRRFSAVLDTSALLDGILLTTISQLGVGAAAIVIEEPGKHNRLAVSRWKGWAEVCAEDWELDLESGMPGAGSCKPPSGLLGEVG